VTQITGGTTAAPALDDGGVAHLQKFTLRLAVVATLLAAIPFLIGLITQSGNQYLGYQTAVDDHMVYAAWMRQAMDGAILFDNRFTTDPQPGLTLHVYFLTLGWVAKVVGITLASNLARLGFTFLFVILLGRLAVRLKLPVFTAKFALILACFGGGLGFLQWQNFGRELIEKEGLIAGATGGWAPIDLWQTEAFVFPSMLVNGLFMVALCLIHGIILAVIDAKANWRVVASGLVFFALLMNVHSYDVLLLGIVLLAWRLTMIGQGPWNRDWDVRVLTMALGILPPALWFAYVLQTDAVFQARAATPTFSATFAQVLIGIIPLVGLAAELLFERKTEGPRPFPFRLLAYVATFGILFVLSRGADPGQYFVGVPGFLALCALSLGLLFAVRTEDQGRNLLWSWAIFGLVALYFPALFQRKLAMGLVIPWGILGAIGMARMLSRLDRGPRNLVAGLCLIVACAPSLYWLQRELWFIRQDVSSTTRHPVFLSSDVQKLIDLFNDMPGRKIVVAFPGVPFPSEETGSFQSPYVPDLNPILSGLAGVYTYAGHWSETPKYDARMSESSQIFLQSVDLSRREELIRLTQADFLVAPVPETYPEVPFADLTSLGPTVFAGTQYRLIDVRGMKELP